MCPGVESDKFGDCPKCGMPLEPMSAGAEEENDEAELRQLFRKLWIGAVLALPVFISALAGMIPGFPLNNEEAMGWRRRSNQTHDRRSDPSSARAGLFRNGPPRLPKSSARLIK